LISTKATHDRYKANYKMKNTEIIAGQCTRSIADKLVEKHL